MIGCDENNKWYIPIYEDIYFQSAIGNIISLIPYPFAKISTSGLKWDLCNQEISTLGVSSVRNQAHEKNIKIFVNNGQLLMICDEY